MNTKTNEFQIVTPELQPNVSPPEVSPKQPEKRDEREKNSPFFTPPEAEPIHETKTYPDKK